MSYRDEHLSCACCAHYHRLTGIPDILQSIEASLTAAFPRQPAKPTVFYGGIIRTMVPASAGALDTAPALGIAGGTIIAIGERMAVDAAMQKWLADNDIQASEHAVTFVDLEGHTLMPGLIDPHVHILGSALNQGWNDVSPFDGQALDPLYSWTSVQGRIQEMLTGADCQKYLLASNDGKILWFAGWGLDPSLMSDWPNIDQSMMDGLWDKKIDGKDVAILLVNASGHLAYANSIASHALNLPATDGVLTEGQVSTAMNAVLNGTVAKKSLGECVTEVMQDAVRRGITMLFDPSMGTSPVNTEKELELAALRQIAKFGPVRLAGGLFVRTQDDLSYWLENHHLDLDNHLDQSFSIKGIKIIADGSNQGLTGFQEQPYQCAAEHSVPGVPATGRYNYKPKSQLQSLVLRAVCQGWPTMVHANGDKAIDYVLDAFDTALNPFPDEASGAPCGRRRALRNRMEHASLLSDDDIAQMKAISLYPSFLIGHVGYWGYVFQSQIFGEAKAARLDRCRSALNTGLKISLHSDHFVSPLGPLRMAEQAIFRIMEGSKHQAVLNADETLTREQALRAVTLDAAWQCHMDHLVGSLEPGKLADLVILAEDPFGETEHSLRDIEVIETWLGGAPVRPQVA